MSTRNLRKGIARQHSLKSRLNLEWLEDRLTPATLTDAGDALFLDLAANESLTIVSHSDSYALTTNQTFADGGVTDANDFSPFGSNTLTIQTSGLDRYSNINLTDSGPGASFNVGNSGLAVYRDSFRIHFDDGSSTTNINSSFSILGGDLNITSESIIVKANTFTHFSQSYSGAIHFNNAVLLQSGMGEDITFNSAVTGNQWLWLVTAGDVHFNDSVTLPGRLVVDANTLNLNGGTLELGGNLQVTGNVVVNNNAVLGNRANISGTLTVNDTATLSPEIGAGFVNSGDLSLGSGNTLELSIDGLTPGSEHDQINVTGSVHLGDAALSLVATNFQPDATTLLLIDNDGDDAITGTFAGLAEGATVTLAGEPFVISYVGGTGNDVTLTPTETLDFGDAPDTGAGTGAGNYNTLNSDNGPSHTVTGNLLLGARIDPEADANPNALANGDDSDGLSIDEDGLVRPQMDLTLTAGTSPHVSVNVSNTTGSEATLYGWIDYNGDGVFDNATERTSLAIASGIVETVTLDFPVIPEDFTGTTYARFRLSTDSAAADPTGHAVDGEVEDYPATINPPPDDTFVSLDVSGNLLIRDINGEDSHDTLTIQSDTTNNQFIISDSNHVLGTNVSGATHVDLHTITIPFASVTGSRVIVDTLGGDDELTLDFSLGDFAKTISYNGGTNGSSGDSLILAGRGSTANATFAFSDPTTGTIDLTDNAQISYTGIEPITLSFVAENVEVNYSDTAETITVSGSANQTQSTSTAGTMLTFENPTTSLTINGGDVGDDSIIVDGFGTGLNAAVVLDGEGGTGDAISWNATDTVAALNATAESIHLDSADISTTGDQHYNGSVRIGSSTVTLTGNNVAFGSTVDSVVGAINSLVVNTSNDGLTTFHGIVGGVNRSGSLTINADGTTSLGADINTVGDVLIGNNLTLTGNVTIDSDSGNLTFEGTIDGSHDFMLNSPRTVTFTGAVGATDSLASIHQAGGRTFIEGGSIITVGPQTFQVSGVIVIRADAVLTSTNSETIRFNKAVHGDSFGAHSLTINGDAFFNFNVGITQGGIERAFTSLTVNGTTSFNGNGTGSLTTGSQTFNGPVNVGLNRTMESRDGADITFGSTIDRSAVNAVLTVNTTGRTIFNGSIGETTPIRTLTTDAGGTTEMNGRVVVTINDQTYGDAVELGENVTMTANNVIFGSTVNLNTFSLTFDVAEAFSTAMDTIHGAGNLIKQGAGDLTLSVDNTYTGTTELISGFVSAKSLQSSAVTVRDGATLEFSGTIAGSVRVDSGGILTPGPNEVLVQTGDLTLDGGALNLDLNDGAPGSGYDQLHVTGTVDLEGAVLNLSGSRTFPNGRSVTLIDNDGSDSVVGAFAGLPEGAKVLFHGRTLGISYQGGDGNDVVLTERSLVVSFDGDDNELQVTGEIGNEDNVRITTPSETEIRIETLTPGDRMSLGHGTGSGGYTLSDNDSVLTIDTTLVTVDVISVNLGDRDDSLDFNFTNTISDLDRIVLNGEDGTDEVTVTGTITLPGRFNSTFETINLHTQIETNETQSYTGDILLLGDTELSGRSGGSVNFLGKIDGAHNLSVTAVGGGASVNFNDAVGSTIPLTSIRTRGRGNNFRGGSITTTGTQTYNGDFGNFLSADTSLTSINGELISFQRPVLVQSNQIGLHSLTIDGNVRFSEGFGRTRNGVERPLESLTVTGTTNLPGRVANYTTGDQTFGGAVSIDGEAEFISTTGGTITFASTLDRNGSVTISDIIISTTGAVIFEDEIGGQSRLNTLTVDAGNLEFNGGLINTRRNMTFNAPIVLGDDVTLKSTRGGRFNDTVDLQAFDLNLETLTFTVEGVIRGSGDVIARTARGTFVSANTYTGQTILDSLFSAQTVSVQQSLFDGPAAIDVVVHSRNVLNLENGSSVGSVQILSRGLLTLDGDSSRATTGSLIFEENSSYAAEVVGTAGAGVDGGHEQVDVFGTVTINNALLTPIMASNLPIGSSYTIINNDGTDAVVGNFSGFAEGRVFNRNGENFQITYLGGDGNDVVITRLDSPVYNFSATEYSVQEGHSAHTLETVTITRSGLTSVDTRVDVRLTEETATAGMDFTDGPIRVEFAAGETLKTVPIEILGDIDFEWDETITLSMSGFSKNGKAGEISTANFTILDDDLPPPDTALMDAEGNLVVTAGDRYRDSVTINAYRPENVSVHLNGRLLRNPSGGSFDLSEGGRIIVHGLEGTNIIRILGNIPAEVFGGSGNDYIYGGFGSDILHGFGGNDYIRGGFGNDMLIGGSGRDYLYGGFGNDISIGGSFRTDLSRSYTQLTGDVANWSAAIGTPESSTILDDLFLALADDEEFDLMADILGSDAFLSRIDQDRVMGANADSGDDSVTWSYS